MICKLKFLNCQFGDWAETTVGRDSDNRLDVLSTGRACRCGTGTDLRLTWAAIAISVRYLGMTGDQIADATDSRAHNDECHNEVM